MPPVESTGGIVFKILILSGYLKYLGKYLTFVVYILLITEANSSAGTVAPSEIHCI